MFRCQQCGRTTEPKEKANIVMNLRPKTYEYEVRQGKKIIKKRSEGLEPSSELKICNHCYNNGDY
jgi:tRNA(Ile2) C34 agmatinyltransferase TiaS